jgi:Bacterial PH domain
MLQSPQSQGVKSVLRVLIIAAAVLGFASAGASAQNEQFWGSSTERLKGNIKVAERVAHVPEEIARQFSNKSIRVFSIDLDSDGKPDYIVVVDNEFQTCYFDSSFSKRHCEKRGVGDGFSYYYFVQLDDDPMLELFDLSGDEDYSDYKLLKFDPKTWTPSVAFEIQPLIKSLDKSHKGVYWGYPWDITDLSLQRSGENLQIKVTFAENPNSNSADEEPRGPKILFEGIPTQGDVVGPYTTLENKFQWKSLRQVTQAVSQKYTIAAPRSAGSIPHLAGSQPVQAVPILPMIGVLRHLLTAVVLAVVLSWLWKSSTIEESKFEAGRQLFPPTRAMRILTFFGGVVFTALFVWFRLALRQPAEWWVSYLFLGFLTLVLFAYPPILSLEVDGIGSRSWFGREKKIRWEDVASLHFNTGSRQFTVRANDGRQITHAGFNADPGLFQAEVHKRTRLPMKITRPGTWKSETFEVPYEEFEAEEEEEDVSRDLS